MCAINYFPYLTIRIERLLSVSVHFNSPILYAKFFLQEYPKGNQFRYQGIQPRLFDVMRDVFESGVAIDG